MVRYAGKFLGVNFRPLYNAEPGIVQILVYSNIIYFLNCFHPIKVKVKYTSLVYSVFSNNRIGGRRNFILTPKRIQEISSEGGFSCTQIALQQKDVVLQRLGDLICNQLPFVYIVDCPFHTSNLGSKVRILEEVV